MDLLCASGLWNRDMHTWRGTCRAGGYFDPKCLPGWTVISNRGPWQPLWLWLQLCKLTGVPKSRRFRKAMNLDICLPGTSTLRSPSARALRFLLHFPGGCTLGLWAKQDPSRGITVGAPALPVTFLPLVSHHPHSKLEGVGLGERCLAWISGLGSIQQDKEERGSTVSCSALGGLPLLMADDLLERLTGLQRVLRIITAEDAERK